MSVQSDGRPIEDRQEGGAESGGGLPQTPVKSPIPSAAHVAPAVRVELDGDEDAQDDAAPSRVPGPGTGLRSMGWAVRRVPYLHDKEVHLSRLVNCWSCSGREAGA